jgi:hypothetical protein
MPIFASRRNFIGNGSGPDSQEVTPQLGIKMFFISGALADALACLFTIKAQQF